MQPTPGRGALTSSLLYFGAFGLIMAGGLISMPIVTRVLTKEEYGLLSLVLAWVTMFAALGRLGFPQATTRFLAEKRAEGGPALRRFCDVMFTGAVAGAVVASVLGFGVSGWLDTTAGFRDGMRIGCLVVFSRVVGSVVFEIYRAGEQQRAFASGQVLTRFVSLALSIVFLFGFQYSAAAVLLGLAIGELVVLAAFTQPLFSSGLMSRLDWSGPLIGHATRYGLPLAIANAGSVLLQYGDRFLIERFLGLEPVARYAVAYDLAASLPMAVFNPVQLAVLPIVFRLWAEEGEAATSAFLSRIVTYAVALAFPIGAIYLLLNRDLILLFASQKYADAANLTPFLLLGVLVDPLTFVTGSGLRLAQRTTVAAGITLGGAALNVLLNLVLLPLMGLPGAAVATSVSYFAIFGATSAYASRLVRFEIGWALVSKSLAVSALAYAAPSLLLPRLSSPITDVLLRGAFASTVFALTMLALDRTLRRELAATARRLSRTAAERMVARGGSDRAPSQRVGRLLVVAFHYPPANASGTLRTLKFSRDLPELGWRPTILTVPADCHDSIDNHLLDQIPATVAVHRVQCFDSSRAFALWGRYPAFTAVPDRFVSWLPFAVARGLRLARAGGYDALFSSSPVPTAHLIALLLHRSTALPWIADFRDPWGSGQTRGRLRSWVEAKLERAVVEGADRILGTTVEFVDELGRRFGPAVQRKALVIPNGYDEDDFPTTAPVPAAQFTVLHAGLLYPDFRHPAGLLRAVRLCLDRAWLSESVRIELLGCGTLAQDGTFRRLLSALRLEGCVVTAERAAHSEALERMARASVLLVIQGGDTRTQVPGKVYEYLRTARPILGLTPDDSATARLLGEFSGVTVTPPEDTEAIARALARLYDEWRRGPTRHDRMREGLERYSRRVAATRLAAELDSVVATAPAVPDASAVVPREPASGVGAVGG